MWRLIVKSWDEARPIKAFPERIGILGELKQALPIFLKVDNIRKEKSELKKKFKSCNKERNKTMEQKINQ